jgi:hypothetical protein
VIQVDSGRPEYRENLPQAIQDFSRIDAQKGKGNPSDIHPI